jgi:hypothetical protein
MTDDGKPGVGGGPEVHQRPEVYQSPVVYQRPAVYPRPVVGNESVVADKRRGSTEGRAASTSIVVLLVGVLICALALVMIFNVGPFRDSHPTTAADARPVGRDQAVTVFSQVSVHGKPVRTEVRLAVKAVKAGKVRKVSTASTSAKKRLRPIRITVEIANRSNVPLAVLGREQTLRTADGSTRPAETSTTVIPAGATRRVVLTFVVTSTQKPDQLSVDIAGRTTRFTLTAPPPSLVDRLRTRIKSPPTPRPITP